MADCNAGSTSTRSSSSSSLSRNHQSNSGTSYIGFSMMQHLIDEMDKSSQRITVMEQDSNGRLEHRNEGLCPAERNIEQQFEALYDEAWRSEDSDVASLHEMPIDNVTKDSNDSGCEEVVNSAIAEVSKDFLSGLRSNMTQPQYGDSDESRISSDTEFKLLVGKPSYARYPETAGGSDTDWNPYGTESDTNASPHTHSQDSPLSAKINDFRMSEMTPFNPPLHSTDLNVMTPSSAAHSISDSGKARLSDKRELDFDFNRMKPESVADFSTISQISEQTFSPVRSSKEPTQQSTLNKTLRMTELEVPFIELIQEVSSSRESLSNDEEKKMIASTSSTGYSSGTSGNRVQEGKLKECGDRKKADTEYTSVMERAKLMGIPEDVLLGETKGSPHDEKKDDSKDVLSSKYDYISDEDVVGKKVKQILAATSHLDDGAQSTAGKSGVSFDYNSLQRDLEEIQDSLHHTLGSKAVSHNLRQIQTKDSSTFRRELHRKTGGSSDSDGDIIPSTTTTPERKKNKMAWDFTGDLGYAGRGTNRPSTGGMMSDISLLTYNSDSQKHSSEKQAYNSDGDETRTSGSSEKLEDHAPVYDPLSEMNSLLAATKNLHSTADVDQVLSTFRNQRRELESRYEQLRDSGLAEKVFRILTNQDPESHADGILSEVSAEEREAKARFAMSLHNKDFNFSSNSGRFDDSNRSLGLPDDVRKKLDLSALSSVESSQIFDKSSFSMPRGFTACDDAKKFLSSQMAKASEKTFNHSYEMKIPQQTVHCYPLFADGKKAEEGGGDDEPQRKGEDRSQGAAQGVEERNAGRNTSYDLSKHSSSRSPQEFPPDLQEGGSLSVSPPDSDAAAGRRKEKYRPYRPPGSKDVYYTESDTASIADSVTTIESTHIGSDDATGPNLPSTVFGSRKDAPANATGIYGNKKSLSTVRESAELTTIEEKSGMDEQESELNSSQKGDKGAETKIKHPVESRDILSGPMSYSRQFISTSSTLQGDRDYSNRSSWRDRERRTEDRPDDGVSVNIHTDFSNSEPRSLPLGISAARRDAKWENREREKRESPEPGSPKFTRSSERMSRREEFDRQEVSQRQREEDGNRLPDRSQGYGSYKLPSDAFISAHDSPGQAEDVQPLSLRIRMMYQEDEKDNSAERRSKARKTAEGFGIRQRKLSLDDALGAKRSSLYHTFDPESTTRGLSYGYRRSYSPEYQASPPRATSSPGSYQSRLTRALSDEHLSPSRRDARLSPAFRRALSPEIMTSIGNRSPLLGNTIERSLAQPPSVYPERKSERAYDRERKSPPPTFLARDRLASPTEYLRSPKNERRSPPLSLRHRGNERPVSPLRQPLSTSPVLGHQGVSSPIQQRAASPVYTGCRSQSPQLSPSRESPVFNHRRFSPSSSPSASRMSPEDRRQRSSPVLSSSKQSPQRSNRPVEMTLEGMSSESEADTEMDREPISRRAQILKEALAKEEDSGIHPNINALWEQFKAVNESNDSSMNSSRMEAMADLLRNPSQHLIAQYLKEREQYRLERQERAELDRERRLQEQQKQQSLAQIRHSSSEEEMSGSYVEILAKKEEERMKRRAAKKKKGRGHEAGKTENVGGGGIKKENDKSDRQVENLFSIPEDSSFEQSPVKGGSNSKAKKAKVPRQPNLIDPNMKKLRVRIANQRQKIDKEELKERRRKEKLKKLEHLLSAKKRGEISDQTLEMQLEDISSTSAPVSDNSQDGTRNESLLQNSHPMSDDSTTAKDSSAEMLAWKAEKERRLKEMRQEERRKESRHQKVVKDQNNQNRRVVDPDSRPSSTTNSQVKLLRLVKDGHLTAEEAYQLALKRAVAAADDSLDEKSSNRSSSDDFGIEYGGRLHKLYSPYSRTDQHRGKSRHAPKLKHTLTTGSERELRLFEPQDDFGLRRRVKSAWNGDNGLDHYFQSKAVKSSGSLRSNSAGKKRQSSPSYSPHRRYSPDRHGSLHCQSRSPSSRQCRKTSPVMRTSSSASPQRDFDWSGSKGKVIKAGKRPPGRGYSSENDPPAWARSTPLTGGVAWQIPMDKNPSLWKEPEPLRERAALLNHFSNASEGSKSKSNQIKNKTKYSANIFDSRSDHPPGIPKEEWQEVVRQDALASKINHCDVDPLMDRVQYILNKPSGEMTHRSSGSGSDSWRDEKPLRKMNLQEAFLARKQDFISRCRERQKRLILCKENRHMQECLRLEREAIFAEEDRLMPANLHAHPLSDNLYQPKRRIFTKDEMKELTSRRYKKLPEVVQKKETLRKDEEYKLNRLRARIFNRKVQREVLKKSQIRLR